MTPEDWIKMRFKQIRELTDALTEPQMQEFRDDLARQRRESCQRLGLPEDATNEQIRHAMFSKPRVAE